MKNIISFLKKYKDQILFIILFLILFIICYLFPYTQDDWTWGSQFGLDQLHSWFKNYNGRYAGNILVLLLTRFRFLRALVESTILFLIGIFLNKIIKVNKYTKYLSFLFLMFMPISIFSQGIAWTSGFCNYVIPSLISLIYIYLNNNLFEGKEYKLNKHLMIPLLFLGCIGCLFIEYMSIYLILLAIYINIYYYIKNKHLDWTNITFLIGTLIGTSIMFSNGSYYLIMKGTDITGYRSIRKKNLILSSLSVYSQDISLYLGWHNNILSIIMSILLLIICNKKLNTKKANKKLTTLLKILSNIIFFYIVYMIIMKFHNGRIIFGSSRVNFLVEAFLSSVILLALLIAILFIIDDKERKNRLILEFISLIVIVGPLLFVSPIGPRCFLPSYIVLVLITLELMLYLKPKGSINIRKISLYTLFIFLIGCLSTYAFIYKVDTERTNYLLANKNSKNIVLPLIPYSNYTWSVNPKNEDFLEKYKRYYNINADTEIKFIEYGKWKLEYKNKKQNN